MKGGKMAKKIKNIIGAWAFLVGIILAIVSGFLLGSGKVDMTTNSWFTMTLGIVGLIVGLVNVVEKEVNSFLYSGIILIITSFFGLSIMATIPFASEMLASLLIIFVPAVIVVAIRNVFNLAKD